LQSSSNCHHLQATRLAPALPIPVMSLESKDAF
jgi:hypothetical protein